MDLHSVRIVVLDSYMSSPIQGLDVMYSEFRGSSIKHVPVLRCFGSTATGQKVCVHIHGVFPYLYVPYDGTGNVDSDMYQIASRIDKAVNVSLNQASSNAQHIYKIVLVSGIPMYGYHPKKHQFFKIYLYNPVLINKVANLLRNDAILGKIYQPHEAHLNFTLQFMIDYNLHGMSNMLISSMKLRLNPENPNPNIGQELFLPAIINKITTCELEGDVLAENIMNRQKISDGNLAANPGIAALWEDERQRKRNKHEDSQMGQFLELKNINVKPTNSHLIYKKALLERLAVLSTEKTLEKDEVNVSVYPAETPNNVDIQNASSIDLHTPSSVEASLDDTILTPSQDMNSSVSQGNYLNITMDDDAQDLLQVLQKLEENVEEDSILSQTVKEDEENSDEFLDLSIPLNAVTTPKKIVLEENGTDIDDLWEDIFDTTIVPQLDGEHDLSDGSDIAQKFVVRKTGTKIKTNIDFNDLKKYYIKGKKKNMFTCKICSNRVKSKNHMERHVVCHSLVFPYNCEACLKGFYRKDGLIIHLRRHIVIAQKQTPTSDGHQKRAVVTSQIRNSRVRKTMEQKVEEEIRKINFRVNKLNRLDRIHRIGARIHKAEVRIGRLLQRHYPNFKVVPGIRKTSEPNCKCFLSKTKWDHKYAPRAYFSPHKRIYGKTKNEGRSKKRLFCQTLDGANDSTSSGEDEDNNIGLKSKKSLKGAENSEPLKYQCLPVSIINSPKVSKELKIPGSCDENLGVSVKTNENSKETKTLLNQNTSLKKLACDINVKRKLDFCNISSINSTVLEEKLNCKYMQIQQIIHKENIQTFSPNKSCLNNSDSDIFSSSDDDESNQSFFKTHQFNLSVADRYDLEANYKAKEGCSTVFTPKELEKLSFGTNKSDRSSVFTPKEIEKLSLGTNKSDKSSSLDLISPGQKNVTEINTQKSSIKFTTYSEENSLDNTISSGKINLISNEKFFDKVLKSKSALLVPKIKAPVRGEVKKSLNHYNIAQVKQQEPFYSNVEDVTGAVEIGYNVLKITSKTTAHLPEFETQTDSFKKFRKLALENMSHLKWSKNNLKNLQLSYCKNRDIVLTPVQKPPTVKAVRQWLNQKKEAVLTTPKKVNSVKIYIPLSPGNGNDDIDMSLTISPSTPSNSQPKQFIKSVLQTPTSSIETSPVLNKKKVLPQKDLTPSLRKFILMSQDSSNANNSCQITGLTMDNTFGFNKPTENLQEARAVIEYQYLTSLVMELHIRTRGDLKPDPQYDSIRAIFYCILNDAPENHTKNNKCKGILAINSLPISPGQKKIPILNGVGVDCDVTYVDSEENLLHEFVKLVNYWDPDIVAGYEIQMLSWGFIIERAYTLNINLVPLLGRSKVTNKYRNEEPTDLNVLTGRIVLDVWRLLRHEIALQSYTFESIVYHILHKRVPMYPFRDLTLWWDHRTALHRHRTLKYYLFRVETVLELFDKLDLIGRTSELARLFGIQFYEVLSRGSQFRVESMMLRLAKPLNFIPVSPSTQQRAQMKAPEYIALVMEPESKLYNDPVIVLDFQSLYPSIIIAYNYCFTTCVGRVECLGKNDAFPFGATQLKISRKRVEKLVKRNLLNFSPCGVAFVKKEVRDGILPRMLREILDTRLMVKNSMKENKDNSVLQKVLHNRQLGLKLIANVTFGYTAANFSGRMCCVEVGDSVVSKARETLQRAIALVDGTPEWGARVVYGDTDSLFVMVPGKSKEVAFEVGKKIAEAVTNSNPDPIKLKLEKVYQPCILQTKKRYVGYMYESSDQNNPVYDAKGIETVRRDGCPAVSKMLEKCLRILFETKDVSLVKKYVLRQFNKILAGRANIQDLTFAKEYRGAAGYKPGACVPALELARKWTAVDKRSEPRSGERVPYIIVNGPPGLPLIRLVRSPRDLLNDPSLRPNALYYITRVIIPPLNRCFNLIGADLNLWFNQMPRKQTQYLPNSCSGKKGTISQYFATTNCAACGEQTQNGLCQKCCQKPQHTTVTLMEKLRSWEESHHSVTLVCHSCTGSLDQVSCISLDCPVLYRRTQTCRDLQQDSFVRQLLNDFLF